MRTNPVPDVGTGRLGDRWMNRQSPASALRRTAIVLLAVLAAGACTVAPGPSASPRLTSSAGPTASPAVSPTLPPLTTPAPSVPPESAPPASAPAGATSVKVYFLIEGSDDSPPILAPVHRAIEPTQAVARAAMLALLAGPTENERAHNPALGAIGSMIHPDTRLLGVDISGGTATVDLSQDFLPLDLDEGNRDEYLLTLAQVTYTLTQFPTVERVAFRVEGRPQPAMEGHEGTVHPTVGRDAYFDQLPPIFLDAPAWGAPLADSVRIAGRARVFEGQFRAALVDAVTGEVVAEQSVLVDCESDCSLPGGGEFSAELTVPIDAGGRELNVRVWEPSARDGSPTNVVEYPLR
jgi:germination protein M